MSKQSGDAEDREEWLHVRMRRGRGSTPVKISRKALEDHFGVVGDERSLASLYASNAEVIHGAIRAKMATLGSSTIENPIEIHSSDLSSPPGTAHSARGPRAIADAELQTTLEKIASVGQQNQRGLSNYVQWKSATGSVELVGAFSADQLELMAKWMRRAFGDGSASAEGDVEGQP
ncbi:hypothetical protein M2282_000028 [Variovorax boronicumulans]|uniref:hypothetical protein n=1 Tax=Variovorax boronicumulans TaxID=436515 RepID=UPI0024745929|nr:hypothetical protein [Variovorax boronicumulans]MDH6164900.1 hypothetical protein [Variovorax boronicumulans]